MGEAALINLTTGTNNIALGANAGSVLTTNNNNIDIGNTANVSDSGIIRIGTSQSATYLAGAVYANGTFVSSSDRNAKENSSGGHTGSSGESGRHARQPLELHAGCHQRSHRPDGPGFYSAFNVGPDDKPITTVDEGGVALAAIQGLNQKLEADTKSKDAEIETLRQSVAELKEMVQSLAEKK